MRFLRKRNDTKRLEGIREDLTKYFSLLYKSEFLLQMMNIPYKYYVSNMFNRIGTSFAVL